MRRLGWYARLCLILSVWWLVIGTVWTLGRDMDRDAAFDQLMYRNCSQTADYYLKFDAPRAGVESAKCLTDLMNQTNKRAADIRVYWRDAFAAALVLNIAALIVALATYWSARFILAGRQNNRNSVLTKDTDIR